MKYKSLAHSKLNIKLFCISFIFLLSTSLVAKASVVNRRILPDEVLFPNQNFAVYLDITPDSTTSTFVLEEFYPSGFEIIEINGLSTVSDGHLRYSSLFSNPGIITVSYILKVPQDITSKNYVFHGSFNDGKNDNDFAITGKNEIVVRETTHLILSRSFPKNEYLPGEVIDVSLKLDPGIATYYVAEDYIPEGWQLVDNIGNPISGNRVTYISLSPPPATTRTYRVKIPEGSYGAYEFYGQFGDNMGTREIRGEVLVFIVPSPFVYTPVSPCKIVDTRNTSAGMIDASTVRSFHVYGAGATIEAQGGNASGCPSPLGKPSAVHVSVTAVNPTGKGNLKAFPVGASANAGLTVNFASIGTNLNNAGTVKTSLGTGPDISLAAQYSNVHATVQVLGYYYTNGDLLYTPVSPCKVVDTRNTSAGMIDASTVRSFHVYGGGSTIGSQGGDASGCPSPLGEPKAVHISVAAVNPTGKGNLKAFPIGDSGTSGLTVNYASIGTNLNNAGTVKTSLGSGPDISLAAQYAGTHATVQVLGYYYSQP